MKVPMGKRHEYWNHFIARWIVGGVDGVYSATGPRLRRIKPKLMGDDDFWRDVVLRHGGDEATPEEMERDDPAAYEHCQGNFWGGVCQDLAVAGLIG